MTPSRRSAPGLSASAARIFDLAIGQMLWSRRSVLLALLVGAPVLLAALVRVLFTSFGSLQVNGAPVAGATLYGTMIWLLYIRLIVPVLGVFYGTSLIADEVDDRTLTYLFTRPIPRRAVLFGKYLAYLACTILLVLPSVVLVYFLIVPIGGSTIAAGFPSLLADLAALAVGLAAYGAVFALVGARFKRPLTMGLVFAFGWEPSMLLFPGYLKRLTVAYYLQALVDHEMPQETGVGFLMQVFHEVPSVAGSLTALALIVVGMLWLAGRTLEDREYVLEQ
jgi:ABC-2 type transport system permease protein